MTTIGQGREPQDSDPHVSSANAVNAYGINVVCVSGGEKSWCFSCRPGKFRLFDLGRQRPGASHLVILVVIDWRLIPGCSGVSVM